MQSRESAFGKVGPVYVLPVHFGVNVIKRPYVVYHNCFIEKKQQQNNNTVCVDILGPGMKKVRKEFELSAINVWPLKHELGLDSKKMFRKIRQ